MATAWIDDAVTVTADAVSGNGCVARGPDRIPSPASVRVLAQATPRSASSAATQASIAHLTRAG
jgi:hypothetical protein